jgi:hypothetical protein
MYVITARNVHEALPMGLELLKKQGLRRDSRNGDVIVMDSPVTTQYLNPTERVLFWPDRDANPFFHLFESLWMLAGRNDVGYVAHFVKRMKTFSDDGETFHGAYGYRWRNWFDYDQLAVIIKNLKANHSCRRQVLQMWDAKSDLGFAGKDLPCNTQVYFSISHDGALDMTVCNRSNDVIWGAYGANAVHFSVLQEYMALSIGVPVGRYWQMSNNYHAYTTTYDPLQHLADAAPDPYRKAPNNPYEIQVMDPFPLMSSPREQWDSDLKMFIEEGAVMGLKDPFFRRVAVPMLIAYELFKQKDDAGRYDRAIEHLTQNCQAPDWKMACIEWVQRRKVKAIQRAQAEDDGVAYE